MKRTNKLLQITNGIIWSGMMVLLLGIYYLFIRSGRFGPPFPDEIPETVMKIYNTYERIGEIITKDGLLIFAAGIAYQILRFLIGKRKNTAPKEYERKDLLFLAFIALAVAGAAVAARGYYEEIVVLGDLHYDPLGVNVYTERYEWSDIARNGLIMFVIGSIATAVILIREGHQKERLQGYNSKEAIAEIDMDQTATRHKKTFVILGCMILMLLWTGFSFTVWICAIFYGKLSWSEYELIQHEPVTGRIAVFLSHAMIPTIWLLVPCGILGFVLLRNRMIRLQKQKINQNADDLFEKGNKET